MQHRFVTTSCKQGEQVFFLCLELMKDGGLFPNTFKCYAHNRRLPVSISLSGSKPSSCGLGLGLQRPGDERGVMVEARVSGPISA